MKALTSFPTLCASRYTAMLCKHFGTRVPSDYDDRQGWVQFPFGRCELIATSVQLDMHAEAEGRTQLDQVIQVITSHLERFAFRENPILDWHEQHDPKTDTDAKEPQA